MSSPQTTALLNHVVSQMQQNIDFLLSEGYISQSDANVMKSKLPQDNTVATKKMPTLTMPLPFRRAAPVPVPVPAPVAAPELQGVYAKAIWGYNENGQDADDLSFAAGDIIEIVAETNADWWMGKYKGREALFPSNYVEKVDAATAQAALSAAPRNVPPPYTGGSAVSEKKPYRPFMAAHHDAPPATGEVNSVGLQQNSGEQEKKKGKFGKYGNTMAHSAAGGVGFGAGAAIGGGLVRAIF